MAWCGCPGCPRPDTGSKLFVELGSSLVSGSCVALPAAARRDRERDPDMPPRCGLKPTSDKDPSRELWRSGGVSWWEDKPILPLTQSQHCAYDIMLTS